MASDPLATAVGVRTSAMLASEHLSGTMRAGALRAVSAPVHAFDGGCWNPHDHSKVLLSPETSRTRRWCAARIMRTLRKPRNVCRSARRTGPSASRRASSSRNHSVGNPSLLLWRHVTLVFIPVHLDVCLVRWRTLVCDSRLAGSSRATAAGAS